MVDSRALRAYEPRLGYKADDEVKPTVWRDQEILHLTPAAPGWWAVFRYQSTTGHDIYSREPIACWAAVRRMSGRVSVVPLIIDDEATELREPASISRPHREFRFLESDFDDNGGGDAA